MVWKVLVRKDPVTQKSTEHFRFLATPMGVSAHTLAPVEGALPGCVEVFPKGQAQTR